MYFMFETIPSPAKLIFHSFVLHKKHALIASSTSETRPAFKSDSDSARWLYNVLKKDDFSNVSMLIRTISP